VVSGRLVTLGNDVLNIQIDPKGGNLVNAGLLEYPKSLDSKDPVQILSSVPENLNIAQSGLLSEMGPDQRTGQALYQVSQYENTLADGKDTVSVDLKWNQGGVSVIKRFTLKRGDYAVGIQYIIDNKSGKPWVGNFYAQIRQKHHEEKSSFMGFSTYTGAAISSADKPYEKFPFSKLTKADLSRNIQGGWVSVQERYFLSAWVPDQKSENHYFSRVGEDDIYTIGLVGPKLEVAPGKTVTNEAKLYLGPELNDPLKALAPHLELSIDYGWAWVISSAIFWVMEKINAFVGNWGWSIILVTLFIKLAFYKLSEKSYVSMAKMRLLTPKIEALKTRYPDDKQKQSKAMMELYRKEKVNPVGGCLPMLLQIPVFIALYYVLIESVDLRQAPFIFWIQDLSAKDPYYILPVLMGASMLLTQMLTPVTSTDKAQIYMMRYGMPIIFTLLFMNFPSGLVLYWLVNNLLSVAQQWYIMKKYEDTHPAKKVAKA
jgi:YidC/Oxa1 family membrane protein insertase